MTRRIYGCVLPVLLFVLSAFGGHGAFADEITVSCDVRQKIALVLSGDVSGEHPNSRVYPVEKISQYIQKKKPTVVCSFSGGTVSVKGGISHEHPRNNNVTIYVDGVNTHDRLWLYRDGSESVKFSGQKVETQNCLAHEATSELTCEPAHVYTKGFKPSRASHPSFSCDSAKSVVEIMICDDDALADADNKLAEAFKAVAGNPKVVADQKNWLASRGLLCGLLERDLYPTDAQSAKACLLKRYEGQLAELKKANAP